MQSTRTQLVTQTVSIPAQAGLVFDLIRDVERWPQWHAPAVHAEYLERGEHEDVVRHWALDGTDAVRSWQTLRKLDPSGRFITFTHVDPRPPLRRVEGGWRLETLSDDTTAVEMWHEITVSDDDDLSIAHFVDAVAAGTSAFLDTLCDTASRWKELEQLVVDFEDPLFIAGSAEDAYRVLHEADKWPERMAHVDRIDMTEPEPDVQFFDMDTRTPDGSAHTTRSVRLCFPHRKIIYKQIALPKLLDAHTGHWTFSETPEGVIATARHAATIKPSALPLLGEGTTVPGARRYLRRVLGANSMSNLQVAKRYAEERDDA